MGRRMSTIFIHSIASSLAVHLVRIMAVAQSCGPHRYYDEQRMVCLDLCDSDKIRCPIGSFCSTRIPYKIRTPECLSYCLQNCQETDYCHRVSLRCRPCALLCSRPDKTQCRRFCYKVYASSENSQTIVMDENPEVEAPTTPTPTQSSEDSLKTTEETDSTSASGFKVDDLWISQILDVRAGYTTATSDQTGYHDTTDDRAANTITAVALTVGIIVVLCVFAGELVYARVLRVRRRQLTTSSACDVIDNPSISVVDDMDDGYLCPLALPMEPGRTENSPVITQGISRLSSHIYDVIDEDPYINDNADGYEEIPDEAVYSFPTIRNAYLSIIDDVSVAGRHKDETYVE